MLLMSLFYEIGFYTKYIYCAFLNPFIYTLKSKAYKYRQSTCTMFAWGAARYPLRVHGRTLGVNLALWGLCNFR